MKTRIFFISILFLTMLMFFGCPLSVDHWYDDVFVEIEELQTNYTIVAGDTIAVCFRYWAPSDEKSILPPEGAEVMRIFSADSPLVVLSGEDTVFHHLVHDSVCTACYEITNDWYSDDDTTAHISFGIEFGVYLCQIRRKTTIITTDTMGVRHLFRLRKSR